jgi:hypothetical protein
VWHLPTTFTKRFTLDGSRLTVEYDRALPSPIVVDNELCVDLFAGVRRHSLLSRATDGSSVTVANADKAAASISIVTGGTFTQASLCETVEEADRKGLLVDFLALHRVLTESVQIVMDPTEPLTYAVELNAMVP